MTVTLQLANQVRRLGRENLKVEQIARRLALPEMAIMEGIAWKVRRRGPRTAEGKA